MCVCACVHVYVCVWGGVYVWSVCKRVLWVCGCVHVDCVGGVYKCVYVGVCGVCVQVCVCGCVWSVCASVCMQVYVGVCGVCVCGRV